MICLMSHACVFSSLAVKTREDYVTWRSVWSGKDTEIW